jgi:hypothetical protein
VHHEYHHHPAGSQVVNTSWAMLALMRANIEDPEPLHKAARVGNFAVFFAFDGTGEI